MAAKTPAVQQLVADHQASSRVETSPLQLHQAVDLERSTTPVTSLLSPSPFPQHLADPAPLLLGVAHSIHALEKYKGDPDTPLREPRDPLLSPPGLDNLWFYLQHTMNSHPLSVNPCHFCN